MNIDTLRRSAATIRDEQITNANTATRVGSHLIDQVQALDELNQFRTANADYLTALRTHIVGTLGTYATWALALQALESMTATTHKAGRYTMTVGGVTYYVTFIIGATGVYWQMVEGGIIVKSDGTLATDTTHYCTFASRYHQDSAWSTWQSSAKLSDIPTPQAKVAGTNTNYTYSAGTTTDLAHGIFSAVFKCYQYAGEVRVTHKFWGSTADYNDGNYISSNIPTVNTGSNGVMHRQHFSRFINTTLTATAEGSRVVLSYPDYANGGTKTVDIPNVTSAHAGVMTVNHLNMLLQAVTDIDAIKAKLGI